MENALRAGVMQHGKMFISPIFLTFFLKLKLRAEKGGAGVRGEGEKMGILHFSGSYFKSMTWTQRSWK